ncbi:hypothetical protein PV797_19325 [Clostridiaceae bacterium M8S5]|nr:hypothetical protein PV797_19325 [Clostridiaceae bacterium M8S5]
MKKTLGKSNMSDSFNAYHKAACTICGGYCTVGCTPGMGEMWDYEKSVRPSQRAEFPSQ